MIHLAALSASAYPGLLSRAFQGMPQPSGENLEPLSCAVFGRPAFFVRNDRKGLARPVPFGKVHRGSRKPSSCPGGISLFSGPYFLGQGCSEYARTVLTHGGPANKLGLQMRFSSPWPRPTAENTGSRKPAHLEAHVANLSPRGGVSLPRFTLPRLSLHHGRLSWEFRCGHTAPAPTPFPHGLTVLQAAESTSCPICARMEALVGRRRPVSEVAHV